MLRMLVNQLFTLVSLSDSMVINILAGRLFLWKDRVWGQARHIPIPSGIEAYKHELSEYKTCRSKIEGKEIFN